MTNIGDRVNAYDLSIPVGTSIEADHTIWTREVDGWHGPRHHTQPLSCRMAGPVVGLVPYVETLAMHQQRFAVTCIAMGNYAGGGGYLTGAREIVENLGLVDPEIERLRVGSWVSSYVNLRQAPVGTLLLSGARNRAEGHSLFEVGDGLCYHLSGVRNNPSNLMLQVVALPTSYDTIDWPEPTEDEADLIRQWRVRSWDEGYRVKNSRGWCSEFENYISVLGLSYDEADRLRRSMAAEVTEQVETIVAVGMVCTADLMDAAPVGTIVSEGPGRFTATKEDGGWRDWERGSRFEASSLYFHRGLTFHTVPEASTETYPRFDYGTVLSNAEQRSCALGAVFAHPGEGETRYVMGRTDENSTHGTRNIQPGRRPGADWGNGHRVIWDGVSPIHEVPVQDHAEMVRMPVDTVIGQHWDGEEFRMTWTKTEADGWTPSTGGGIRGESAGFFVGDLRYAYIPVPGVPRPANAPVPQTAVA